MAGAAGGKVADANDARFLNEPVPVRDHLDPNRVRPALIGESKLNAFVHDQPIVAAGR
jgi:hypothetical protein